MEQLKYMGEYGQNLFFLYQNEEICLQIKLDPIEKSISFDLDTVAWSLGFKDAIDMISHDSVLDLLSLIKKLVGRWPFADFSIEENK